MPHFTKKLKTTSEPQNQGQVIQEIISKSILSPSWILLRFNRELFISLLNWINYLLLAQLKKFEFQCSLLSVMIWSGAGDLRQKYVNTRSQGGLPGPDFLILAQLDFNFILHALAVRQCDPRWVLVTNFLPIKLKIRKPLVIACTKNTLYTLSRLHNVFWWLESRNCAFW